MEWIVQNAVSRDVERQHLNKILKEIKAAVSSSSSASLTEADVRAIVTSIVAGIPSSQIRNFNINLAGDVEGSGTVNQLTDVTIPTTIDPSLLGVEEAPMDSNVYWRGSGAWQAVPGILRSLSVIEDEGLLVWSEEEGWVLREIEGVAGEIVVTDGDGIAGNPTIGLEDVVVTTGGSLMLRSFDAKGRLAEEDSATTDDLDEGTTNLYFTDERAQDAVGLNLLDTATVDMVYNDATGQISANVQSGVFEPVIASGTTGQFWRGDKTFTNTITGPLIIEAASNIDFFGVNTSAPSAGTSLAGFGARDSSMFTSATINYRATETWTGSAKGTRIQYRITPNGTAALVEVATMDDKGFGVGTATPNYAPFARAITIESPTNVGFEFASTRPDASGVLLGAFSGNFRTASAGHQRLCDVQFTTDGATPGQRGGELGFYTKPDASTTLTRRWVIGQTGHLLPATDNTYDLGSGSQRCAVLYAGTGTINTSDAREKTEIVPFTAAEIAAAKELSSKIGTYRWLSAVARKGENARHHVGMTVQEAIAVMEGHGLDPFKYGFICYDEWEEQEEIAHEEGTLARAYRAAGSAYSFRMDELLMFIARGFEERLQLLESQA